MTEDEIDKIHKAIRVASEGHVIWLRKAKTVTIQRVKYPAYRVVWAVLTGAKIGSVPQGMVAGCGFSECVAPEHMAKGLYWYVSAGWRYDRNRKLWKCKRGHYVEIVGRNKNGSCNACQNLRKS